MRRRVATFVCVALGLLAFGIPFAAAAAPGAQRVELVGPLGNFDCDTGDNIVGAPGGFGFVVLNQVDGRVTAKVSLRNAEPEATYIVRLIQHTEDIRDCHGGTHRLRTNAAGNGNIRLSETVFADAVGFNVSVNTKTWFGAPQWVGARMVPAEADG